MIYIVAVVCLLVLFCAWLYAIHAFLRDSFCMENDNERRQG